MALTDREKLVLAKLASGRRYKEAGAELYLSHHTVKRHVQKVNERTGSRTTAQAVAEAVASGDIVPGPDGEFSPSAD
jgi:DNA-binding CsgD family transcriptional regulator